MLTLYSANCLELINGRFFAFHISGGTSQVLLVEPNDKYFKTDIISDSLDLKAGQAVDRVGLMLGLSFPCGPELERLALTSKNGLKKLMFFGGTGISAFPVLKINVIKCLLKEVLVKILLSSA